jgi:hypothetical protein
MRHNPKHQQHHKLGAGFPELFRAFIEHLRIVDAQVYGRVDLP